MKTIKFLLSDYLNKNYESVFNKDVEKIIREYDCDILDSCELAVNIYRIQNRIYKTDKEHNKIQKILSFIQRSLCGCEIYYSSQIGNNFLLVHGLGVVIGSGVRIGNNVTVYQNVTLGTKYDTSKEKCTIGNDVIIYAGAKILGNVKISNNSVIGANSVILKDVGEGEIFAGVPGEKIGYSDSDKYKLPVGIK